MTGIPPELRADTPLEEEDRSALQQLPVFPLPNVVLFPQQILPLYIFEQRYRQMVNDALEGDRLLAVSLLKPGWEAEDAEHEPHEICGVGQITRVARLVGGNMNLLLHGLARVRIERTVQTTPYRLAEVSVLTEPVDDTGETSRLAEGARGTFRRVQAMKPGEDREATQQVLKLLASPIDIFNYLCAHSDFDIEYKQELLEMDDIDERLRRLTVILSRDLAILN